jgi:SAM-dependent methyltransferase
MRASVVSNPEYLPRSMTHSQAELDEIRRSRRHPRVGQHDYLHLRYMVDGLRDVLAEVPGPVRDVLDVWCGTRPYDDLLPPTARIVGLDVEDNPYGAADVVSDEFLPFPDESFDLVVCIQSFQYVPEPEAAISEFHRVLRPGGIALVALPFALEYDPRILERRYTGPQLVALFDGWDDVTVREYGRRAVTWTVLTASMLRNMELRATHLAALRPMGSVFRAAYALLNGIGLSLARVEDRRVGTGALPMNLIATARRPGQSSA